jgi:hypothetical protein
MNNTNGCNSELQPLVLVSMEFDGWLLYTNPLFDIFGITATYMVRSIEGYEENGSSEHICIL